MVRKSFKKVRRNPKWKSGVKRRGGGRWRINKKGMLVHMFKRQAPAYEITNTSTQGIVTASDGNQIGMQTPVFESAITGGGASYRFGAVSYFKLSNVLQNSDFTNMYDRYKINAIKLKIIPLSSQASVNGQGLLPTMVYHTDYDDAETPTSDADVRVKQGAKEVRLDKPVSIFFRPKIADAILGASAGTAYSVPKKAPYINMAYNTVPHYGLKMYFRNVNLSASTTTSTNTCFRVETTYYLSCRDPQ